jgi:hypothetical protein
MVDLVCPLGVGHLQPIPRSIARFLPVVLLYLSKDYSLFGTYPSVEFGGVFHDYDTFLGHIHLANGKRMDIQGFWQARISSFPLFLDHT